MLPEMTTTSSQQMTLLPSERVLVCLAQGYRRYEDSLFKLNETRVDENGNWAMDIRANQLSSEEASNIIFEMDGQYFQEEGQRDDERATFYIVPEASVDEGISTVWIIIGVVVVLALIVVVAFVFFVEFEEEMDLAEESNDAAQPQEDPYAWAKNTPEIPAAGGQAPAQQTQAVANTSSLPDGFGMLRRVSGSLI